MSPQLDPFRSIWVLDFEFVAPRGERPNPVVCMVAHELRSGRTVRLGEDELRARRESPIPTGPDALHVAYFSSAEWSCYLALGWPLPTRVVDLFAEHRLETNLALGKAQRRAALGMGDGLVDAARMRGLDAMDAADKSHYQDMIKRGGPWDAADRSAILDYCETDVVTTTALFRAMASKIDLPRALLRGRYFQAVARMESVGTPIDVETFEQLRDRWDDIKLRIAADDPLGVFDGTRFSEERFDAVLNGRGIWWPRFASGRPILDDDTFKAMTELRPEFRPIRRIRQTLAETRLFSKLAVGRDGRNRTLLGPFGTATGRNAPRSAEFVFSPAAWVRGLIQPEPGRGLAYVDYSSQEFGIAAYLSGDPAMVAAYESRTDVYIAFGVRAGIIPPDAMEMGPDVAKARYRTERKLLKAVVLGSQYGLGAVGLARQIGRSRTEAADLLTTCRRVSPGYWRWSDGAVRVAMLTGRLHTCFGWATVVHPETRPTSLLNWPIQAHASEVLRLACCMLSEQGIAVCAPIHDAVLVEAPVDRIDDVAAETQAVLADASAVVLGGPKLRSDVRVVRYPDRLIDDDARPFWDRVVGYLADARVAAG